MCSCPRRRRDCHGEQPLCAAWGGRAVGRDAAEPCARGDNGEEAEEEPAEEEASKGGSLDIMLAIVDGEEVLADAEERQAADE